MMHPIQSFAVLSLCSLTLSCSDSMATGESAAAVHDDLWTQEELEAMTAEIQAEVEEIRGAKFKHPVDVEITDKEGFLKYVMERVDQMGGEEKMAAEEDVAKLLGIVPPDMDVLEVTLGMLEEQVGGFYDPAGNKFYLMDSFTGPVAKVILAHELTHALDDQYFDLDGKFDERLADRDASSAFASVVEGSGTSLMTLWTMQNVGELQASDLQKVADLSTKSMEGVPAALWKPLLASYQQGQMFLNKGYRLLKRDGKSMEDITTMAFQNPPTTMEQVLHPEKYWDEERRDDPRVFELYAENLPDGWKEIESSTLGELYVALMTEESDEIDFSNLMAVQGITYTNDAARGWGGDRVVLYGKDESRLLSATIFWDTEKDAEEFGAAMDGRLENWRASVAQLDEGELGSNVQLDLDVKSLRSSFHVWFGVNAEGAGKLIDSLVIKESESTTSEESPGR